MGLAVFIVLAGIFLVGFGIGRKTAAGALLASAGWCLFLIGTVGVLVPGFF